MPVAVGLGSNLGDRLVNLCRGVAALRGLLGDLTVSPVYETEPRHREDQPRFLNACCTGSTHLSPAALLAELQRIEAAAGRRPGGPAFGPRVLDLDLLLYGERVIRAPGLRVPHPRMAERAFVLVPLAEVAGDWRHPELGQTVRELARAVPKEGVALHEEKIGRDEL